MHLSFANLRNPVLVVLASKSAAESS